MGHAVRWLASIVCRSLVAVATTATFLGAFLSQTSTAQAVDVPQSFTLDGKLFRDATGTTPLTDSAVNFKVQILDQDQICVVYEEQQVVNTASSQGYFTVQVGSSVGSSRRTTSDSGNSMAQVFQNISAVPGKLLSDGNACTAAAAAGQRRFVRITIAPSSMGGGERVLAPNLTIDSVPNAIVAERAESVQGFRSDQLLKVNTAAGSALSQSNLESLFTSVTRFNALSSVVDGNSSSYVQNSGGGARLPVFTGAPTTPTQGSIWYDSGDNRLKYFDGVNPISLGTGGGSVSSVGFTAPAELSVAGAPITTTGTIAVTWAQQTTGRVFASPNGSTGVPTFRALVAADAPFAIVNGGGTPSFQSGLDAAKGTASTAGRVWIATDTRLIYRDTGTVWEQIGGSGAPSGTAGGDLDGTYPNPSVDAIRGVAISATAPNDGQVLKYFSTGTTWAASNFGVGDLKTAGGAAQFASASCAASQTITWSSLTNTFTCSNIAGLDAAAITTGTIDAARLPASANPWTAVAGGIGYSSGSVGIGTTTPRGFLDVFVPSTDTTNGASIVLSTHAGTYARPELILLGTRSSSSVTYGQAGANGWRFSANSGNGGSGGMESDATFCARTGSGGERCAFHADFGTGKMNFGGENASLHGGSTVNVRGNMTVGTSWSSYGSTQAAPTDSLVVEGMIGAGVGVPTTSLDIGGATTVRGMAAPALSPAGQGRIYFSSGDNKFKISQNGSAYTDLAGGAGSGFVDGGNTFGSAATLGTDDAYALNFETSGSTRMTVAADGKVGINTPTPTTGNLVITDPGPFPVFLDLRNDHVGSDYNSAIRFQFAGTRRSEIRSYVPGSGFGAGFTFFASDHVDNTMREKMRINQFGNVGIGTDAPNSRLSVVGPYTVLDVTTQNFTSEIARFNGNGSPSITLFNNTPFGSTSDSFRLRFRAYNNNPQEVDISTITSGQTANTVGAHAGFMSFSTSSAGALGERMRISETGNVGVGTTAPRAMLDVNGAIVGAPAVLNGTTTIDFSFGNMQYTAANCGSFALRNMKDGGSYSFLVQGTGAATCSFTAHGTADTSVPLTVRMPPDHGAVTSTRMTLYSFMVYGSTVIVAWTPGY